MNIETLALWARSEKIDGFVKSPANFSSAFVGRLEVRFITEGYGFFFIYAIFVILMMMLNNILLLYYVNTNLYSAI
ncbi:MAG: hypothetical protein LWX08_16210, partial [Deltaproteobacteria bacterium]|nr:hypothetical protein [Deltaproteobacteria bacterium]